MSSIASSTLIFSRSRESRNSGTSLYHYNGLKLAEATQLSSASLDVKGFITTSGALEFLDSVVICLLLLAYSVLDSNLHLNYFHDFMLLCEFKFVYVD